MVRAVTPTGQTVTLEREILNQAPFPHVYELSPILIVFIAARLATLLTRSRFMVSSSFSSLTANRGCC